MNGRRRLIFLAIIVSLVGITTGLLLGSNLLSSRGLKRQYAERPTSIKTDTVVVEHSHDGLPLHKHVMKATITTIETTPHGDFHDFAPAAVSDTVPTSTTHGFAQAADNAAQTTANAAQTITDAAQTVPTTTKTYEVWLYYDAVVPTIITIPVGATVTWINKDTAYEHTVNSDTGNLLDIKLAPRGSLSFTFTEPGAFPYHCEPHPHLVGTVIVK